MNLTALTIAGSDCSGGAGIQADLKTFAAHKLYGMSAITAVVAENTCGVIDLQEITPDIIQKQITAVFEDIPPDTVKIGMMPSVASMEAVAGTLAQFRPERVVADPVMMAKDGGKLMQPDAIHTLVEHILPLATVVTPNLPEAEALTGRTIHTMDDIKKAARQIREMGVPYVLIKGGHLPADMDAKDILYDGTQFYSYTAPRIPTRHTHGTGCTLSSAIAAQLALGCTVPQAVSEAKQYVTMAITHALKLGKGNGPTHHLYQYYEAGELQQ